MANKEPGHKEPGYKEPGHKEPGHKELAKIFVKRVLEALRPPSSPLLRQISEVRHTQSGTRFTHIPGLTIEHWKAAWEYRKWVEEKLDREFQEIRYYFLVFRETTTIDGVKYYNYSLQIRWRYYLKCC